MATLKKILPQKTTEQTVHICLSSNVLEDLSDTGLGEQEVAQPSETSEKEKAPQQLRWLERIQKSNPKYVNTIIIKDEIKGLETYEETSHNTAWQPAMEEETIALEQNQNWELV